MTVADYNANGSPTSDSLRLVPQTQPGPHLPQMEYRAPQRKGPPTGVPRVLQRGPPPISQHESENTGIGARSIEMLACSRNRSIPIQPQNPHKPCCGRTGQGSRSRCSTRPDGLSLTRTTRKRKTQRTKGTWVLDDTRAQRGRREV